MTIPFGLSLFAEPEASRSSLLGDHRLIKSIPVSSLTAIKTSTSVRIILPNATISSSEEVPDWNFEKAKVAPNVIVDSNAFIKAAESFNILIEQVLSVEQNAARLRHAPNGDDKMDIDEEDTKVYKTHPKFNFLVVKKDFVGRSLESPTKLSQATSPKSDSNQKDTPMRVSPLHRNGMRRNSVTSSSAKETPRKSPRGTSRERSKESRRESTRASSRDARDSKSDSARDSTKTSTRDVSRARDRSRNRARDSSRDRVRESSRGRARDTSGDRLRDSSRDGHRSKRSSTEDPPAADRKRTHIDRDSRREESRTQDGSNSKDTTRKDEVKRDEMVEVRDKSTVRRKIEAIVTEKNGKNMTSSEWHLLGRHYKHKGEPLRAVRGASLEAALYAAASTLCFLTENNGASFYKMARDLALAHNLNSIFSLLSFGEAHCISRALTIQSKEASNIMKMLNATWNDAEVKDGKDTRVIIGEKFKKMVTFTNEVQVKTILMYGLIKEGFKASEDIVNPFFSLPTGDSFCYVRQLLIDIARDKGFEISFAKEEASKYADKKKALKSTLSHIGLKEVQMDTFKCLICQKAFGRNWHLQRHQLSHTGVKQFECSSCLKKFSTSDHLLRHRKIHLKEPRVLKHHTCPDCTFVAKTPSKLLAHSLTHLKTVFLCGICFEPFDTRSKLTHHSHEHAHRCAQCHGRFLNASALRKHLLTHADPTHRLRCPHCPKSLANKRTLAIHINGSHLKLMPFKCHLCSKVYGYKSTLDRHIVRHAVPLKPKISPIARLTGNHEEILVQKERNFACYVQDCSLMFRKLYDLERHLRAFHDFSQI